MHMDRYREKTSVLLARLAHGLGRKQRPTIDRFLAPQTSPSATSSILGSNANLFHPISAVFKLPDELILSILSYIFSDPHLSGHYARFHMPYSGVLCRYHDHRARFLRPLSMTCRAMRLRLLPWVLGRLEIPRRPGMISTKLAVQELNTILNGTHADKLLAVSVKYFCPLLRPWTSTDFISFDEGLRRRTGPTFIISLNV